MLQDSLDLLREVLEENGKLKRTLLLYADLLKDSEREVEELKERCKFFDEIIEELHEDSDEQAREIRELADEIMFLNVVTAEQIDRIAQLEKENKKLKNKINVLGE